MKTSLLSFFFVCSSLLMSAQGDYNLVVFSEDGMKFDLLINSVKQNDTPSANVRVTGLLSPSAAVWVQFANGAAPDIKKNMYFQTPNTEVTAKIVETKKGLKLRYFGEVALAQAPPSGPADVVYREVIIVNNSGTGVHTGASTTTTTTHSETIETSTGVIEDGDNVNVDINIGGVSFGMDVNMGVDMEAEGTVTETFSTTTTTTSTTGHTDDPMMVDHVIVPQVAPCSPSNIGPMKAAIEGESFEDDRLDVAKLAMKRKCVTVAQVKELAALFTFEDNKLEFIKFAYDNTLDQDEYYQLNSVLTYSSSKEELNEFLQNK